jgi:undecaprenyl diphosphate synthase
MDLSMLPRHIAIIMDGNGRWAKKRGQSRTSGHKAGGETFRRIADYLKEIGIPYFTVYAFSTENWKRPPEEVGFIMRLLRDYLIEAAERVAKDNISMHIIGNRSILSPEILKLIDKIHAIPVKDSRLYINICLNYGGRDEITNAVRQIGESLLKGSLKLSEITEDTISEHLYTKGVPDPDLIIRPSGEYRISNFLLWQSAYSEYYFTDVLWPDFDKNEMNCAIADYQRRSRRFGGI